MEQVYWYTPWEASNEKKWGRLWFLQCGRCRQERNHGRRMEYLECAATLRAWRLRQILRLLDFEEVRILRNILWRWRRLSYGWPLCAAPPADRTLSLRTFPRVPLPRRLDRRFDEMP